MFPSTEINSKIDILQYDEQPRSEGSTYSSWFQKHIRKLQNLEKKLLCDVDSDLAENKATVSITGIYLPSCIMLQASPFFKMGLSSVFIAATIVPVWSAISRAL
jgi:hypothetical protein